VIIKQTVISATELTLHILVEHIEELKLDEMFPVTQKYIC